MEEGREMRGVKRERERERESDAPMGGGGLTHDSPYWKEKG